MAALTPWLAPRWRSFDGQPSLHPPATNQAHAREATQTHAELRHHAQEPGEADALRPRHGRSLPTPRGRRGRAADSARALGIIFDESTGGVSRRRAYRAAPLK